MKFRRWAPGALGLTWPLRRPDPLMKGARLQGSLAYLKQRHLSSQLNVSILLGTRVLQFRQAFRSTLKTVTSPKQDDKAWFPNISMGPFRGAVRAELSGGSFCTLLRAEHEYAEAAASGGLRADKWANRAYARVS
eukprot:15485272-Alexandrium_andersonii.AAC.2